MLTQELSLPDDPREALRIAISLLRERYKGVVEGSWESFLWKMCKGGLASHYWVTNGLGDDSGITKEHVIGLRRLSRECKGWFVNNKFVKIATIEGKG